MFSFSKSSFEADLKSFGNQPKYFFFVFIGCVDGSQSVRPQQQRVKWELFSAINLCGFVSAALYRETTLCGGLTGQRGCISPRVVVLVVFFFFLEYIGLYTQKNWID